MNPFTPALLDLHCPHRRAPRAGRAPSGLLMEMALASSAKALAVAVAVALGLAACGGGGGGGGTGDTAASGTPVLASATTGAFSQGTITGFGSIVVNGVRFDESTATITDDAGNRSTAAALGLGMRVEVDHGSIVTAGSATATATAGAVRFGSLVLGKVSAKDAAASSLTVLGQVVDVTPSTVFDSTLSAGLSAVAVGSLVEVHGVVDAATGHITATRVEAEASATGYKLRGTVAALDSTAKTFQIGGASISYAGLAPSAVPSTLANGVTLRVQLATAQTGGLWVATSLGVKTGKPADLTTVQVRGAVSAFTSATAFSVDGLAVDASAATFPDGKTGLVLGAAVEVKGAMANGVLVATQVELETRHQDDDDRRWQLFGAITAADATAKTVVVRGVTVTYGDATTYVGGTVADLRVGHKVHVKGTVGSTRTQVQASSITFE